jgi:hypothetical protein
MFLFHVPSFNSLYTLCMHKIIAVFTVILLQVVIIIKSIIYLQSTFLLCYIIVLIWYTETVTTHKNYKNMETKTLPLYYVNSSLGPA